MLQCDEPNSICKFPVLADFSSHNYLQCIILPLFKYIWSCGETVSLIALLCI